MTVNDYYKFLFNAKTYKLSLDAGCTCPNRDGTKGKGGCIFCSASGSGDFTPSSRLSVSAQIEEAKKLLAPKLKFSKTVKYIAYFQSFTNTYGDFELLKAKWEEALACDDVVGLSLATRPDCISDECLFYLAELSEKTYVQLELGLQTSNDRTALYIRRAFPTSTYRNAVERIKKAGGKIHVVTHVIFGLPGESEQDMMNTVKEVVLSACDGIKITCLYILKNTDLEKDFIQGKFKALEMEEYFELVKKALKLMPASMVIHRLTGDPPKALIIEPKWTMNKKLVLNKINELLY